MNLASALLLRSRAEPHAHSHDHAHAHAHAEHGDAHQDHNLRSAHLHVLADALTSVFAIAALCAGKFLGWGWTDALCGLVGALVILRWSIGLAALAVVFALAAVLGAGSQVLAVSALLGALLLATASGKILGAVLSEHEVGFKTILGAISVYVLLGILFTYVYLAVDKFQGGDFFGQTVKSGDFVFFSITTLTTTGYGNLVPAAQPGKMLSGLEMLTGQIFVVTLIAGLVSLWRPGARRQERSEGAAETESRARTQEP